MPSPTFEMPRLADTPKLLPPGLYFDLPFAEYLAQPANGSGLLRDVLTDPLLYWSRSWLNPNLEKKEADHFLYGQAFHCRILEGSDEFEARYYVEPNKADYPDLIVTTDDLKAALADFEIKPKSSLKKPDLVALLREEWPDAPVWDEIVREHAMKNGGKTAIKAEWAAKFEIAADLAEKNEALFPLLTEGYSEVSLFWSCPRTGIPMKARFDRLQLGGVLDVKTFANMQERSLLRALPRVIANEGYFFQTMHYLEGAQVVRALIRDARAGKGDPCIHQPAHLFDYAKVEFGDQWADHAEPDIWTWLFVQKGEAPSVMGVRAPLEGMMAEQFALLVQDAAAKVREMAEQFGAEPWAQIYEIWELEDNQIPAYAMEV